jgi:predicted dehydrogenase
MATRDRAVAGRTVRVGVLGAARIVSTALLRPSRAVEGLEVVAIAARDPARAARYATKHDIARVHRTYDELLDDPAIDAVYIPLPSALHARWMTAAIEAGKHVLCEKPFTSNAGAARQVAAVAAASDVVVMEAYHSAHHPVRQQILDVLGSGELGEVVSAAAVIHAPIPPGRDIRWDLALGGGALLDLGYYPLRLLRDLFGEVVDASATARIRDGVDGRLEAELVHAGGVSSTLRCAMWSVSPVASRLDIRGTAGRLRVGTPWHPQLGGRLRVDGASGRRVLRPDRRSTYLFQLEAFREAVRGGPVRTGPVEAVAQLDAIDRIYAACGLRPRPSVRVDPGE